MDPRHAPAGAAHHRCRRTTRDQLMDMLLAKKRASDRRDWLEDEGQPGRRRSHGTPTTSQVDGKSNAPDRTEFRGRREAAAAHLHREGVPRLFDVRDPRSRAAAHRRRPEARAAPHHLRDERARPRRRPKHKKSARTVGDVIGKFHPHGDSACYEAMVQMAQPFSLPLSDRRRAGQLGFADDPKSFAAMRYTESQAHALRRGAAVRARAGHGGLAAELRRHAGGAGAAAGAPAEPAAERRAPASPWACPPTFRRTTCAKSRRPASTCSTSPRRRRAQLMKHVQGPGLPDRRRDHHAARRTAARSTRPATARFRRARRLRDGGRRHRHHRAAVPGVRRKVLEQIAAQMRAKKLPMVEDMRDESDHENPTRLVIVPRSNRVDVDAADGAPVRDHRPRAQLPRQPQRHRARWPARRSWACKTLLDEWLAFRIDTVTRRLQYRLEKVDARLHILDGLLIAYLNLDEVIRIIRTRGRAEARAHEALQAHRDRRPRRSSRPSCATWPSSRK